MSKDLKKQTMSKDLKKQTISKDIKKTTKNANVYITGVFCTVFFHTISFSIFFIYFINKKYRIKIVYKKTVHKTRNCTKNANCTKNCGRWRSLATTIWLYQIGVAGVRHRPQTVQKTRIHTTQRATVQKHPRLGSYVRFLWVLL